MLGGVLLLGGCGTGQVVTTIREISRARQQIQQQVVLPTTDVTTGEATPLAPDEAVLRLALEESSSVPKIAPTNSGPGLVVCEPIVSGAQAGSTPARAQPTSARVADAGCI